MEERTRALRKPNAAGDLIAVGGEMADRIRAFDWSKTAIGPIESWSASLRTMVGILLANRFPCLLWWGPEYVQLYNDAYVPIPGAKHPGALGQRGRECWSEIWDVLEPLVDTPFRGGPATWNEDLCVEMRRHGFLEETHFTIAYSSVPDETAPGGIGGVLATVVETTARVVGERRLVALRDVGARAAEARSAEEACAIAAETLLRHGRDVPFALLYLIDADGTKARLAGAAGVAPGEPVSPKVVDLHPDDGSGWPFSRALRDGSIEVVSDLAARFPARPHGPWSDPPPTALVVPMASHQAQRPAGLLVAAVSPRRPLDDQYRGFFELLSTQVAQAVARARAYEDERKRAEALAAIDRAKTAFFSNVSHEFRTPLTLLLGPLEDLLGRPEADLAAALREPIQVAHRNGLRLLKLVNALLDFSRIEAGRTQAAYEPTDLAALTADLSSSFRSAIERAGLRFVVDCAELTEPVYVDRDMWEKIVLNLLSNALKFTFEGAVEVRLRAVDGHAELAVRDTGAGIPESELSRVFERFHRVESARGRTHEGTGIGLALVHELARLHGGSVSVESVEGKGSTFRVRVPLGSAHLPADRVGGARPLATTATGASAFLADALLWLPEEKAHADVPVRAARARVLLADDNADMRGYLARLLVGTYEVESVADGHAALEAARRDPPDIVVTDVMMPRRNGFELLAELRADPRTKSVPILVLSARAGEEARVEGLTAGADDYLVKPFSAQELLARVAIRLRIARMSRETAGELERQVEARTRDLERVNRELQEQSERLLRSNVELERFAYVSSHDLQEPLRMVVSFTQLLASRYGGKLGADADEYIHFAVDGALRMQTLIRDLLAYSRVHRAEKAHEPVELSTALARAVEDLRSALAESGARIETSPLPVVLGNPVQLSQVFQNLLGNAMKFRRGRSARIVVRESVRPPFELAPGECAIEVADDGIGIAPEYHEKIFVAFRRLHTRQEYPGNGIGLAICRKIVEAHGGRIGVESEPGRGSSFHFSLRRAAAAKEAARERGAVAETAG